MVEPTDVRRVPYGVGGEPEADDMVDRFPVVRQSDVGQPRREVRRPLPAKPDLGRPDHGGVVPRLAQRRHEPVGDDEVSARGEQWMRRDDRYSCHRVNVPTSGCAPPVPTGPCLMKSARPTVCPGLPSPVSRLQ